MALCDFFFFLLDLLGKLGLMRKCVASFFFPSSCLLVGCGGVSFSFPVLCSSMVLNLCMNFYTLFYARQITLSSLLARVCGYVSCRICQ